MGILKDRSQLEFYIDAVERWAAIAAYTGTPKEIQAELILTIAFKQNPELCKEMSDHFGSKLRKNKDGIKELVKWLKSKFGLNKHADMVKILNTFLNTCRNKNENLLEYITRFERNYHEVKKMGETFSATCLSILLLRQAQLSDTDSQIITINLDFDPKADDADQNFDKTKAAMKKFQHTKQANHVPSHGHQLSKTETYIAALEEEEGLDSEQLEEIKTLVAGFREGRGRGGFRNQKPGGKKSRVWKCDYCLCSHPRWRDCGCPCVNHTRDNCPKPVPALVAAYKKRKAEWKDNDANKKRNQEGASKETQQTDKGYLGYARAFTEKLGENETEYENTLVTKDVRETESGEFQPLTELFQILEIPDHLQSIRQGLAPPGGSAGEKQGVGYSQSVQPAESLVDTNPDLLISSESEGANFRHRTPLRGSGVIVYAQTDNPQAQAATVSEGEKIFLRDTEGSAWRNTVPASQETHKLHMLLDCGSPSTIIGVEDYQEIKAQYPEMIQANFEYKQSNKRYEFGGGEKTYSMGRVRLPMYVLDEGQQAHLVHVWVDILKQQRLPLLFGGRSLIRCGGTLCFKTLTFKLDWKGARLSLPIKQANTGHFHLQFFPMSNQEDAYLIREMTNRADWTVSEVKKIVTYLAEEESPEISKLTNPTEIKTKQRKQRKPLNKQQIIRLHQALGHAHRDKIRDMVKSSKMFDDQTLKYIDDLAGCEVCAVEHNRIPRPRIAAPRSTNFNHVLAIDLKENKRFKNAPPFIMYFVDTFTRFKAAVFIKNKNASTIAEHLVTEWIKFHGAPKYLMSDRGTEFLNGEVRDLCQFHGIRFTSTASYSPHQNSYCERGHQTADRALERMITADPALKPEVALAWVIQAVNTLQNVNGFVPFQLVFGRIPRHPSLVEDNPGANQEIADSQAMWARHYRMMMAAREAYTASESDRILRKALEQRVYTNPSKISPGDWIYFKRNPDRYWKGPAKLLMKDGKSLHCIFHGQPVTVNSDDVLLNKPEAEEFTMEQFVSLPQRSQPPTTTPVAQPYGAQDVQTLPGATGETSEVRSQSDDHASTNVPSFHDNPSIHLPCEGGLEVPAISQQREVNNDVDGQVTQQDRVTTQSEQESELFPDSQGGQPPSQASSGLECPATSTNTSAPDLGTPLQCILCDKETSSKNFHQHCGDVHSIQRPSVRQHAKVITARPDSIYENFNNLKPGVVVADDDGNYLSLVKPTATGWTVQNISSGEKKDLELVRDMTDMRYVGMLEEETPEGIMVVNSSQQKVEICHGDYTGKVFFTSHTEYNEETVYVTNIPRSRHNEPECVAAKTKELKDFQNYDVYEVVDKPENKNIIGTEWVLVEKEKPDGSIVTKARLCLRGDQEQGIHLIPRESPTVNKISVKILVTLAISQGWDVRSCDVERAFLQTEDITREIFVKPPVEMNLPRHRVLRLKRAAYGLVDASRSFFLKQAREFKNADFHPLSMDPALFLHRPNNNAKEMCDAASAVHVDDAFNAGKPEVLDEVQQKMRNKLTYGTVDTLPFRFLGSNYRKDDNGDMILDQKHYVDNLEIPNMDSLKNVVKQDVLSESWQSTFRSLASKVNVLASTVRPDFTFAAKYLTTRYNKATKSDLTQVVKLIKRAKEETTEIVIPNVGQPEQWILVGVVDASHRTSGNLFAVGGHVVMLVNKHNKAAAVLHWSSKKIERVVHSSTAAETLAMQKMFSTIYLVRRILSEMCGERTKDLQCVALTDNQALFSNLHHIKANSDDYRLQSDIIELRQSIEEEKTVQEIRYVHSSENIADCLTKTTKSGHMLLQIVRTGQYDLPGGTRVRDSTMTAVRTWNQLMRAEQQDPDLAETNLQRKYSKTSS